MRFRIRVTVFAGLLAWVAGVCALFLLALANSPSWYLSHPMEGIESGLSASVVYVVPPILFISCLALALPARISTGLCVVIMVSWLAVVFGWWAQKPWSYSGEFPWWGFQRHFLSVLPVPLATALGFALALRNIRGRDRPHDPSESVRRAPL